MKTVLTAFILILAAFSAHANPASISCDFQNRALTLSGHFQADGKLKLDTLKDDNSAHGSDYVAENDDNIDASDAGNNPKVASYSFELGSENWSHVYILTLAAGKTGTVSAQIDFEYGDEYGETESEVLDGTCTLN